MQQQTLCVHANGNKSDWNDYFVRFPFRNITFITLSAFYLWGAISFLVWLGQPTIHTPYYIPTLLSTWHIAEQNHSHTPCEWDGPRSLLQRNEMRWGHESTLSPVFYRLFSVFFVRMTIKFLAWLFLAIWRSVR